MVGAKFPRPQLYFIRPITYPVCIAHPTLLKIFQILFMISISQINQLLTLKSSILESVIQC